MSFMDFFDILGSPISIVTFIGLIWCIITMKTGFKDVRQEIKDVRTELGQEIKDLNQRFDKLESNDLAHIERHNKLVDVLLIKQGIMTRETYYALWGEEAITTETELKM